MLLRLLIIFIPTALLVYLFIKSIRLDKANKNKKKQDKQNNLMVISQMTSSYGEPTVKVLAPCYSLPAKVSITEDVNSYLMVFEPSKKIFLKGKMYDFSQIKGYTVSVNNKVVSSGTSASTGSVIGRAALGGALFGGVGAIIGAASANTNTDYETINETVITVFTNSISEPSVVLDLVSPDKMTVAQIEGILRIITTTKENNV